VQEKARIPYKKII